ncbi:hypothetical protein ACWV26_11745 [Rummeliibacillus sp. JY-2-4R]
MDDKQKTVFRIKDGDNMVELTPSLLDEYLSKRDSKTLYNLLLKQEGRKVLSECDQSRITLLLSRLEINMLSNKYEDKTDLQKKRIENLLYVNKKMENKYKIISMSNKLLSVLAILYALFMIVLVTGKLFTPSIYMVFLIVSLFVNVFISILIIYCKEHIWNWKVIDPLIKIIWWIVLLINMAFAARSILQIRVLIHL